MTDDKKEQSESAGTLFARWQRKLQERRRYLRSLTPKEREAAIQSRSRESLGIAIMNVLRLRKRDGK